MKIAFLGSRGIPARYSGFETFYEQLAIRLAQRGHRVTVYNRSHFIPDVKTEYRGVRIVSLPSVATKHLDTITHTVLSSLHALFGRYDIVYYCIVGNSPLVWIPRLTGAHVLLNVDGQDWAREKWSAFARWYQRCCERLAPHTAQVLIADARVIQQRYARLHGAPSVFVPYGANIRRHDGHVALEKWGLKPRGYVLYVGRLVPENSVDLLLRAFAGVRTEMRLVIVGDAPYAEDYKRRLRATADPRVVFTGYAFGEDYAQLSSQAYLYVQPSGVDGTRPALLDQLGFGNCVVVRNSPANLEALGDYGCTFDAVQAEPGLATVLQALIDDPGRVESFRIRATERIAGYYNWDWITLFYEDLFRRLADRRPWIDYDEFIAHRENLSPV